MLENSKVILSKNIKVDREMKNVLSYSPTQLINLMADNDHLVASDNHCSFIRERGTLQIDIDYSRVLGSNYMAYQNSDYSNKWFFCWIDEVLYKGNNNTEIVFTVDPFETFYSDIDFENAYVIREHVNDDTIGANTVPENIDTGDMIIEDALQVQEFSANLYGVALEVDGMPDDGSHDGDGVLKFHGATEINKLISGHGIILFRDTGYLADFLHRMNVENAIQFVHNMFIYPSMIFQDNDVVSHEAWTTYKNQSNHFYWYVPKTSTSVKVVEIRQLTKNHSFTGYTPKNNKCFVYPYNYLLASNNVGGVNIYKYEDFSDSNCNFDVVGCFSVGGSWKLIPKNYKGISANYDESLPLAKYPTCGWATDGYTSWLTQNAANEYASAATNIISGAVTGGATGGGFGALAGAGLSAISEVLGLKDTFDKAKLLPYTGVGSNTGDVNWAMGGNNFVFKKMRPKLEYLRIIDNYFTRVGYKVNRLKTPNITGRRYFNYVQVGSSDDVASGSIPQKYMKEINDAFRKGITIWHDHNSIGNYSVSNTIV